MPVPQPVMPALDLDLEVRNAAKCYFDAARGLRDRSYWPVRMFVATNLFLRHLDIFDNNQDPEPQFVKLFSDAAQLLELAGTSDVCGDYFSAADALDMNDHRFEKEISGLFSDIWIGLTDDIYFDQSYDFTKTRFEKSGVDPAAFFKDKVVLDAGCGSGKFSAAIARLGAPKVIGMDIGEKGLDFAREQARKVPYGERLDYRFGSLLDIPLDDASVDIVWSNGVIHHTLGYERCIEEFARVTRPGGHLFLYVNGRFGLFELLLDTVRPANEGIPRALFQHYLHLLGINSGRVYFMMDCFYAPYEWKTAPEVKALLAEHGFGEIRQLTRGVAVDAIEQISARAPYAKVKYGEGQLKFIARKTG